MDDGERKAVLNMLALSNSALGRKSAKADSQKIPKHMRPVFGYCRYSTQGQHETSIEKQKEYILEYAKQKELRTPEFFSDRAQTGRTEKRPSFRQMLSRVRPGTIVIVHEITRFARETHVFLGMIRQIQKAGGTIEFVNVGKTDGIYLTILAAMAEYDFQNTVTRLRDGRMQAAAAGKTLRRVVFGYRKVGDDFEIDEDKARFIRTAFRMRANGASYSEIGRYMEANHVQTESGGQWTGARVARLLYQPLYAGYVINKRPIFEWEHEDDR